MDFDLSEKELGFRDHVRRVIDERISPEYPRWREEKTTPRRMFEIWGEENLLGFFEEDGEIRQIPWLENIHLYKELARYSGGLGIATFVQGQLGNQALYLYADDKLREEYLKPGIKGKRLFAFANTEPSAGSDASAIKLKAEDKGDHYIVNGMKAYITNADFADDIIFTAVTDPNAEKRHKGISMFIIPGNSEGLQRIRLKKFGWAESHLCTLRFERLRISSMRNRFDGSETAIVSVSRISNSGSTRFCSMYSRGSTSTTLRSSSRESSLA